jgi:hypothetical protein
MSGEFRTILKGGLSMPRSERGKTKTNQAISMHLHLDDNFQRRKEILLQQSQDRKYLQFFFLIGHSLRGPARAESSLQRTNAPPRSFDDDPGRKPSRDS